MDAWERAAAIGAAAKKERDQIMWDLNSGCMMPSPELYQHIALAAVRAAYEIDGVDKLLNHIAAMDMETSDHADFWQEYHDVIDYAARVREAMGNTREKK